MRASDLLGSRVVDGRGQILGRVIDLRSVQNGPLRGVMCAPRIESLIVSPRRVGSMLGYQRHEQQGPWAIRAIVRGVHRHRIIVPWASVDTYDGDIVLKP
jgi:sporulation protein YlmC with PRC-barrel domain